MFCNVECCYSVVIPFKSLDTDGLVPRSTILTYLLKQMSSFKAAEEFGYLLSVTKLKSIGNGNLKLLNSDKYIHFPVTISCRTFLPRVGEIMLGVVHTIQRRGVFLKCGPLKCIYLSARKMPNYYYVDGKNNSHFLSDDRSRIDVDVVIRFAMFGVRWDLNEREFTTLATLEGDSLGPMSLPGPDGLDL